MYQGLLEQVEKQQALKKETLRSGCDYETYFRLREDVKRELSSRLPPGYAHFLRLTDGFYWNGVCLFASEKSRISGRSENYVPGIVEENLNYRNGDRRFVKYLVFGKSAKDGFLFVYNVSEDEYQILDEEQCKVVERIKAVDTLISYALQRGLFAY